MKIHFCDLCNESVPHTEFEQGRAYLRKGRVICARCEGAMSTHLPHTASGIPIQTPPGGASLHIHAAGAAPGVGGMSRSEGGTGLLAGGLAGLSIAMVVVVSLMFSERLNKLDREAQDATRQLDQRIGSGLAQADARSSAALAGLTQAQALHAQRLDQFEPALAALAERAPKEAAELRVRLDSLLADNGRLAALERSTADQRERLGAVAAKLDALAAENARLAQELALARDAARAAVPAAAAPAEANEPEWMGLVRLLGDPSPTERWSAVDGLGRVLAEGEAAVVPYLLPMLDDSDTFVRMVAARIFGDARTVAAVDALIDALEDGEPSVREAALVALRSITARDHGFDPLGSDVDRAKKVKAWRDWWKKAAADFGSS
ncbi:MAG: hypothetical protein FJ299_08905 [Planctomycetes bacterium]|nr:hypothetical protein [Planctomycetota bacterium]